MGNKPDDVGKACQELLRKYPEAPTRTLAKRIALQFEGVTVEQARARLKHYSGTNGKESLKNATRSGTLVKRDKGRSGWTRKKPPSSLAEPWLPFELEGVGRVGVISDCHYPYHSEIAMGAAVEYLRKAKIDCLLINGDCFDFYTVSRHQKNPAKRDFSLERMIYREALEWIRGEFPSARIVFKKGNHEERWDHWLWNHAPEICDMPSVQMHEWLGFAELEIEMVEEQRPILVGKLPILHGHELQKGFAAPVNPARGAYLRTSHTVLVSHSHQTSSHSQPNMFHDETVCWSIGCLCDLTPEYARINRWCWGFAMVEVADSGEFNVSNYRISKEGAVRSS